MIFFSAEKNINYFLNMAWSCNLRGQCEDDYLGNYNTLAECENACQAVGGGNQDAIAAAFLTIDYQPELALELAPNDQAEYLWTRYKIRSDVDESAREILFQILFQILTEDYTRLAHNNNPTIREYVHRQLTPFELFVANLVWKAWEITGVFGPPLINVKSVAFAIAVTIKRLFTNQNPSVFRIIDYYQPADRESLIARVATHIANNISYLIGLPTHSRATVDVIDHIIEDNWGLLEETVGPFPSYEGYPR